MPCKSDRPGSRLLELDREEEGGRNVDATRLATLLPLGCGPLFALDDLIRPEDQPGSVRLVFVPLREELALS